LIDQILIQAASVLQPNSAAPIHEIKISNAWFPKGNPEHRETLAVCPTAVPIWMHCAVAAEMT
jgi:hypothetical protein